MKIPETKEELDKAAKRIVKNMIYPKKGLTIAEIEASGVPVYPSGRPLRGERLREYMENGYITYPRKRK